VGPDGPLWRYALFDRSPHQLRTRHFIRRLRRGEYRKHFIFAFVRNPYDRLASCWRQKLATGGQGLAPRTEQKFGFRVGIGFSEFVEAVHEIPDEEADAHFRSQYVPLLRPNGRLIPHFLGRFENLAGDFATVAQKLGVELRLPYLLASSAGRANAPYQDLYDRKTERLVAERFAKDLELFGYGF
jgi:chondroitin 4-sulfotransferase 11